MKVFSLIGECHEKSELVGRLVGELTRRGVTVSTIKRVGDRVDLEKPGSGTWKQREAGATEIIIANARRYALLHELPPDTDEPDLPALLSRLAPVDIVLLDGFRRSAMPKLEVVPDDQDGPKYVGAVGQLLALSANRPIDGELPCLKLDEIGPLADFVLAHAAAA